MLPSSKRPPDRLVICTWSRDVSPVAHSGVPTLQLKMLATKATNNRTNFRLLTTKPVTGISIPYALFLQTTPFSRSQIFCFCFSRLSNYACCQIWKLLTNCKWCIRPRCYLDWMVYLLLQIFMACVSVKYNSMYFWALGFCVENKTELKVALWCNYLSVGNHTFRYAMWKNVVTAEMVSCATRYSLLKYWMIK